MIRTEDFLTLIDIVRDLNKTVSIYIDNPKSDPADNSCLDVCACISNELTELEKELTNDRPRNLR